MDQTSIIAYIVIQSKEENMKIINVNVKLLLLMMEAMNNAFLQHAIIAGL